MAMKSYSASTQAPRTTPQRRPRSRPRPLRRWRTATRALAVTCACVLAAVLLAGCGTSAPKPVARVELAAAETFPYFPVYWVGRSFEGSPLAAADGLNNYIPNVGDGVYYGDCVQNKGVFGGGSSCALPLQVTTVIYVRHSNEPLGAQRNILVRGVPAVVYDEGRSMEVYSGHVAIDIFSTNFGHALRAAEELYPMNAPGSQTENLPPPVYCPGLYGPQSLELARVTEGLPNRVCQHAAKQIEYLESVKNSGKSG